MTKRTTALWALCLFALAAGAALAKTTSSSSSALVGAGTDWPGHSGAADESSYSRLAQITPSTIGRLGLGWSLQLPDEVSLEATPVEANGMLYFTGSLAKVYAVEAASGKVVWTYDPETWKVNPFKMMFAIFPVNRGVAYDNGRIFSASIDGRLFALDAKTGKVLWSVETVPAKGYQTITGAPRTFNGKVIIGHGGADIGTRGYVTAYDQATGRQLWRFYTVPGSPDENRGDPVMERAAASWRGEYWKTGTGGAVWDGITFDPELNRIYFGTANGGPHDPEQRSPGGGDTLYTASIIALDANTGKYVWHYQVNPRDAWDYDCTQQITLARLVIDGKPRRVLMQAPKNGFFYVLDRDTGKLISAGKIGKVTWAERIDVATGRPVEMPNIRYEKGDVTIWPSTVGAHNWQAMSFSPKTGLVYIPYMQIGTDLSRTPKPGAVGMGTMSMSWSAKTDPMDDKGALLAWDPVRQKRGWIVPLNTLWNGGTLATAGGLVFQGSADGYLSAYDAATGRRLWRFNAGLGIIGAPISYSLSGKQFVSVLVGYGGSTAAAGTLMNVGWKYGAQPRWLLTFTLDGKAVLPASPPPDMTVHPVDNPAIQIKQADVEAGRALFNRCGACHGMNLISSGAPGPDLLESQVALDPEALWSVVHDGALLQRGMPRYDMMTREQVMQIYAYIRAGARDVLAQQKQGTQSSSIAK